MPTKTKTTKRVFICANCARPVPVRNELAAELIEKVGRPMCAECRTKVCEVKA